MHTNTAALHFCTSTQPLSIEAIGDGNINDTYLVHLETGAPFVLQRLSRKAFSSPELTCQNIEKMNSYLAGSQGIELPADRRWQVAELIKTKTGELWWIDEHNNFWRALSYVDRSKSISHITNLILAQEVGQALGIFHNLLNDIPAADLEVTIPHFHDTPHFLRFYQEALDTNPSEPGEALADECHRFISEHQGFISTLEDAKARGELKITTIHGDPKLANILFDSTTLQACALIDLDTVGPGLLLYDLGDCLRSCCNRSENASDIDSSHFDADVCLAILQGYLKHARHLLSPGDKKYLFAAIRLIPFELGLRFFTDYLTGCHYFKTNSPEETLRRAVAQFRLVASIARQQELLQQKLDALLGGK